MPTHIEAVIVAGGFGTRLRPLTDRLPKHLLNVGGVPFLEHQISRLAQAGVDHVVLATSYRADLFEPVLGDGRRWGIRLQFVQEAEPLGTAGAIRNVSGALRSDADEPVVILNGDILSGHDLRAQIADFRRPRDGVPVDVSLHLVEVPDARPFGCVPTDSRGRVTGFMEKSENPVTRQINAGCYVFRRDVIDEIPGGRAVSVERETFPSLVERGRLVVGYVDTGYWRDVGTPEALVEASKDLVLGKVRSPAIEPGPRTAAVAAGAKVADSATVEGGSVVADGATVADGAAVTGSVVMSDAVVEADAVVTDSAIGPGAVVGVAARLMGVTVGSDARVTAGAHPSPGTRIEADATV